VLFEQQVYRNDIKVVLEKAGKSKKGQFKKKDDSVYNPHNNSEDENGECYEEIKSMIS
jgi:hypothetical protein